MQSTQREVAPAAAVSGDRRRRLWRYLRFLGCPRDHVDDVVQEALLAGLSRWPAGDAPEAWLLGVARNQLRKLLRARGRRRELHDVERLDELWRQHADERVDATLEALRACLRELPRRSRAVVELRYGEGLGREAIGARVGLGAEGVKSLLVRVRAALARCVRRRRDG